MWNIFCKCQPLQSEKWGDERTVFVAIKPSWYCWIDGVFFIVIWLVSQVFVAGCWKQCTRFLLFKRILCACVHFTLLLFFPLEPSVYLGQRAEHLTLPSRRWASPEPAGRKSCYIWFQVPSYSKPHTSLWRFRASMIQCQGAKHLLIRASTTELISMEGRLLLPPPPSPASWCHKADFISKAAVFTAV